MLDLVGGIVQIVDEVGIQEYSVYSMKDEFEFKLENYESPALIITFQLMFYTYYDGLIADYYEGIKLKGLNELGFLLVVLVLYINGGGGGGGGNEIRVELELED
ncbi:MAG: hypothetical protein EZS28_002149 [Streblomastix strix]|uniref:Uncharacterized protein n=1 Tax=Streblomastix strix TaxID=222440 RepID=A0A5J4X731_9EUKA|nr:MAG: hypothetical protein EZS28_002149 [Streblomastix strix]